MATAPVRGKSYGPAVRAEVAKWNRVLDSLRAEVLAVVRAGGEVVLQERHEPRLPHPFDPAGVIEPGPRSFTFHLPAKPRAGRWTLIPDPRAKPGPKPRKGGK